MSRLLPYNLKNNYLYNKKPEVTENEEIIDDDDINKEQEQTTLKSSSDMKKYMTMEQINQFLPLFIGASNNKNYMGRCMCAHAILPFIPFDNISEQIINIFNHDNLNSIKSIKRNHNFAHGILLQIYFVLKNHYKLSKEFNSEGSSDFQNNLPKICHILDEKWFILSQITCPFVPIVYLQIASKVLRHEGINFFCYM